MPIIVYSSILCEFMPKIINRDRWFAWAPSFKSTEKSWTVFSRLHNSLLHNEHLIINEFFNLLIFCLEYHFQNIKLIQCSINFYMHLFGHRYTHCVIVYDLLCWLYHRWFNIHSQFYLLFIITRNKCNLDYENN